VLVHIRKFTGVRHLMKPDKRRPGPVARPPNGAYAPRSCAFRGLRVVYPRVRRLQRCDAGFDRDC
jgi:hypothetical protein